jgi:hypothetical protein
MLLLSFFGWGGEFGKALQELGQAAHYTRAPAGLRAARHGPPLASTGESPNRPRRSLPTLLKDTLLAGVAARSERRWKAILNECDADGDESLSRRELLVLLQRLESPTAYSHCS